MAELLEVLTEVTEFMGSLGTLKSFLDDVPRRRRDASSKTFYRVGFYFYELRDYKHAARMVALVLFKTIQLELWWILDSMEHWIREFTKELLAWLG
jgi:hypothetical protein